MILIEKYSPNRPILTVYFYGPKKQFYIKRFIPEFKTKKIYFIHQGKDSYLELVTSEKSCNLELEFIKPRNKNVRPNIIINPIDFIGIKGVVALGNQLSRHAIKTISLLKLNTEINRDEQNDNNQIVASEKTTNRSDNQMKMNF